MFGKPGIRGLRFTVSDVLDYLASGMTEDEILADFPYLELEDIKAALRFAADRRGEARVALPDQRPASRRYTNTSMKYPVALRKTGEGYSVSCPGLPGCWSQGATEQEALDAIRDAIREYLAVAADLAARDELREVEVAG